MALNKIDKNERGSWLLGFIALYLGFLCVVWVYIKYVFFMFLLISPFLIAIALAGGTESWVSLVSLFIILMAVFVWVVWFSVKFFFPVCFAFVELGGFFFQKAAWVSSEDTLGVVRRYEGILRADYRAIAQTVGGK